MPEAGKRLIAGAMSGTSADGVDVAIVETTGRGLAMTATPVAHAYEPFSPELRRAVLDMRQAGAARFEELAHVGREITLAYVRAFRAALAKANVLASDIAAIGAHGQTLWHGPPNTIQYFDPSLLAIETGCAVVSDFRRADLAVGGQGAPLVPFADWILFRHPTKSRVILNIGGIANLTYLKAGGSIDEVIAFDTGPGMCLSDWLVRQESSDTATHDEGGGLALAGVPNEQICWQFADETFVDRGPPKSTDGPAMIRLYEEIVAWDAPEESSRPLADRLATVCAVTARCISTNLAFSVGSTPLLPDEILIAGGGAENEALVRHLKREFSTVAWSEGSDMHAALAERGGNIPIRRLSEIGFDGGIREAIAFALLAAATLDGEPSNVPSATGASRKVILGSITPRPI